MTPHKSMLQPGNQTVPWGVARVNGPLDGTGKTAWIIDSGIDQNHDDLNVDTQNSISYISGETANDNVGHGTYVAGILAAINNSDDVVGVAAGATVVAVKVCDSYGCPKNSILDGIDYVDNHASSNDIINMSLGGDADPDIDNAVIDAADSGLRFTIAAGNDRDDAGDYSPARVNHSNVWTVSAYREGDEFAENFDCGPNCDGGSNYGNPPIEYSAPGEDVPSLRVGGGSGMGFPGTGTEDGTSYAAPHIAGLLLAASHGIDTDGTVSNDPDGNADPIVTAAPEPTLSVTISGPTFLASDQVGTWTANVSNNDGQVSYKWYRRDTPNDSWSHNGGTKDTYSTYFYNPGSSPQQSGVKVEVTSTGETDSAEYPVIISSSDCNNFVSAASDSVIINDPPPCTQ